MRRLVQILLFLVWVDESRSVYALHLYAPFDWVRPWLLEKPIASVRPLDLAFLVLLAVSVARGAFKVRTVAPMKRTLLGALGATLFALGYGLATGGVGRFAGWQAYLPASTILAAFTVAATHRTAEHFRGLFKALTAAGVLHAVWCVVFHLAYIKTGRVLSEGYEGSHDDTILWASSIAMLVLLSIQYPTVRNRALSAVLIPLFLAAIQFNNRRLAWVSLIGALLTLYALLPASKAKRRLRRAFVVAMPVVLLYVAIGWGRPEGIFRPLRAFQTVSTEQDASTKARNMENLGLIATISRHGFWLGSGWGHKYVEVSSRYQIYFFELWPYVPHNSVLGLFAYTGYLGFMGYWMMFPMAAFFHARVARNAVRPLDAYMGSAGVMQIVACANQWYGDMGSFSPVTMYTLATTVALALRLPVASGVWPEGAGVPRPRPAPPPAVA